MVFGQQLLRITPKFVFDPLPTWISDLGLVVSIVSLIGLAVTLWFGRRNRNIYYFRMAMVHAVKSASDRDVELGNNPEWRWEALSSVTYREMMTRFWRPLESFYSDPSFLLPPESPDEPETEEAEEASDSSEATSTA